MKDDSTYLRYVLECIRRIEEDTAAGREQFLGSRLHQDAVLRNLQTMSETLQRLSARLRSANPEVEWSRVAAFRNVLVHAYLGIDMERVWEVVCVSLPVLKAQAIRMLQGCGG